MKLVIIAFAALLMGSAHAAAQELWAGTRAGMSVDEVKVLFPDAVSPASRSPTQRESRVLLTVPETQVAGEPFRAAFIFRGAKLDKVGLVYTGAKEFSRMVEVYDAVLASLRARHGPEMRHRSERGEITNNEEHTWIFADRTIQMSMTSFDHLDAIFAIRYQAKAANGPG